MEALHRLATIATLPCLKVTRCALLKRTLLEVGLRVTRYIAVRELTS
jgi:hypothetical protein